MSRQKGDTAGTLVERWQRRVVMPTCWQLSECWEWAGGKNEAGYGEVAAPPHDPRGNSLAAHRVAYEQAYGPIPQGLAIDHLCCNRWCQNPRHLEAVTPSENSRRAAAVHFNPDAFNCGHPRSDENTAMVAKTSTRVEYPRCRICTRLALRRRYERRVRDGVHIEGVCKYGHASDPANWTPDGRCRECSRRSGREHQQRLRDHIKALNPQLVPMLARGEQHPFSKLTDSQVQEIRLLRSTRALSITAVAAKFGISKTHVKRLQRGGAWTHLP